MTKSKDKFFNKDNLKGIAWIALALSVQLLSYFVTKPFIQDPQFVNQDIDNYIPLIKFFVVFYVAWYFMIAIVPFMIYRRDRGLFKTYITTNILMYIASAVTFAVYPTIVYVPQLETTDVFSWALNIIYTVDSPPLNAIPSGHAMSATLMFLGAIFCKRMKRSTKAVLAVLSILALLSTVFTKQHALQDPIYGIVYATVIFIIVFFIQRKLSNQKSKE